MADLVQTAASVAEGANATYLTDIAGEAISAGDAVYQLVADSKIYRALNDTVPHAAAKGIALNSCAAGQRVTYQYGGEINPGATVTVGEVYGVSVNAGKIAPVADLGSSKYRTILGYGKTTSSILIDINATGILKP